MDRTHPGSIATRLPITLVAVCALTLIFVFAAPGNGSGAPSFAFQRVAEGFDRPVFLVDPADDSGRLFVVEQRGLIRILQDGVIADEPLLDLSSRLSNGSEQGLLGMAAHPDFATNGLFYVNYTDQSGATRVVEFRELSDGPGPVDLTTERLIIQIEQPFSNHNGGMITFGPDGFLYIGIGDGGGGGDQLGNAQNTSTLLGSILRIDVNQSSESSTYAIPDDNPFVGSGEARPEIWAYGLRNPWRFSFDSATGELWIGDVGQQSYEEISRAPVAKGGLNFGWNLAEGPACFAIDDCESEAIVFPVFAYGRDLGISVTGGYVYNGPDLPSLVGSYIFGDYGSGRIWILAPDGEGDYVASSPVESGMRISSFAEDASGSLYVIDHNGAIDKIVAVG